MGVELRWVALGGHEVTARMRELCGELEWGEFLGHASMPLGDQGRILYDRLSGGQYDGVVMNVFCGVVPTNIVRYLPERIPRVGVVHTTSRGTYVAARSVRDYLHHTVAVSPRIRNDLVRRHGFKSNRVSTVPNALPHSPKTAERSTPDQQHDSISIIYLGRIEDQSKGVSLIPRVLARLSGINWRLIVAGDGPDRAALERACLPFGERVAFLGAVRPSRVCETLAQHDVFLMPSRYEGFGLALVEAMAAGCVPVASRIAGVTDWIVRSGETGFLFRRGSAGRAASILRTLSADPMLVRRVSERARDAAIRRFNAELVADDFARVLAIAESGVAPMKKPLPIENWRIPAALRPGLRSKLPESLKKRLRSLREELAR